MMDFDKLLNKDPYSLNKGEKNELFVKYLNKLTKHHYNNCKDYKNILIKLEYDTKITYPLMDLPFLPVRLFKIKKMLSVDESEIIKTMTSSGTTGDVSKIYLDKETATNQTKVLSKMITNVLGPKRLPMLIIDSEEVIKDRKMFSARGAGILGFSMYGTDRTFALDKNMKLDFKKVEDFCNKYKGKSILIFGFTSIIWTLFKELATKNKKIDLSEGILIHGGGWKKLTREQVDNNTFKKTLKEISGLSKIYNYYGMVEQTGSIFIECEQGHLHCSIFSDIIIRDKNFEPCKQNERGFIELFSLLPHSYPGHIIITEDLGEILGEDNCPCGKLGKYFRIYGRIQKAEIRGCSDSYE